MPVQSVTHAVAAAAERTRSHAAQKKRDGQAFVLVNRDGKEFHVYGTGEDRLVVCLRRKTDAGDAKTTAPSGTTGSS